MNKFSFIFILFFLCINQINAQELHFENYSVNDGLPHSDVSAISQDSKGFIWIGTYNGLTKFDGYTYTVYRNDRKKPKSISNNRAISLLIDKNFIWVGTETAGINRYNIVKDEFESFKHIDDNPTSLSGNNIFSIARDNKNRLWVATNKGLNLIRNDDGPIEKIDALHFLDGQARINNIISDQNFLWLCTTTGIIQFDTKNFTSKYFEFPKLPFLFNAYQSIKHLNNLFIASDIGLVKFNITTQTFEVIDNRPMLAVYKDNNQNIWVGSKRYGLLKYNAEGLIDKDFVDKNNSQIGIKENEIKTIFKDFSGVLWFGTLGGGIYSLNLNAKKFFTYRHIPDNDNSISSNRIFSFYEGGLKNLWIGTRGGGLNVFNREKNEFLHLKAGPNSFSSNNISSIYENEFGGMWIGTWSGLYLLTPSEKIKFLNNQKPNLVNLSNKFGEPNLCVFRITKDNDGYLWLSTSTGIYCYQPGSNMFDGKIIKKYINNASPQKSLTDYYINDILIEKGTNGEKSIWVATKNGLNNIRINGKKETIRKFYKSSDANGLRENFVSFLYKSKDNQIYLGMLGGGLGKIISGRKENEPLTLKTYSTDDGLRNNDVETLLEDKEGNLWLAGEGLTKFNPKDETYRYYDVRDGLQSNSFKVWAAYKTSSGEMMFGGTNGFNIFNPDSIKDNLIAPKVALTDFKISNKSVNVLKEINGRIILESNLNYTKDIYLKDYENDISIEFAALQYASPENNRYKYILEGFEDNYNNVRSDKRFATYTNLAPGDYVFKVLASNSDGIWIKKPVSINIHIAKPWLLTNLALFIYLFLFIVIFYLIRRYSLISINEKHQLVLERLEHKKNDEMIDLKTQFFTSMSHEFRTPLTLIVDPVNELYRQSKDNKDYQNKLETIKYSTDRLLHLVDQMIDFRKIDKGHLKLEIGKYNISKLISDVKVNFNLVAEKRSINFTYQPIDYEVWMDKDRMENVLFNILSNAFNYTKNGGKIEIKCSLTDEHLEIVINDNGVGIPKSQLDEIFVEFFRDKKQVINKSGSGGIGLFFVKSIIDEHHGKIEVESQENTFTKFTIKLLRGNNHFNEEQLIEFEPEEIIINNFSTDKENEAIEFNHILKHKTVLVVEDNKDVREYLIAQLKPYYQVLDAENGLQGIKIASIEMPDIIVSDIMMPGIDGIALCQRIKTNIETSHIPVILLTAKSADEQKIKGFEVGADDYITKPFSSNILISRINNILKNREIVINRLKNSPSISPSEVTITPLDEKLLQKVINLVEENISDEGYSVEKLSSDAGVSRPQLYRKLKVLTDMSINEFIRNIRLKRAANLLKQDDSSVSNVMYEVGYSNKSYFTKTFSEMFGVNPKEYKKSRIKFDENSNQTTDS